MSTGELRQDEMGELWLEPAWHCPLCGHAYREADCARFITVILCPVHLERVVRDEVDWAV